MKKHEDFFLAAVQTCSMFRQDGEDLQSFVAVFSPRSPESAPELSDKGDDMA